MHLGILFLEDLDFNFGGLLIFWDLHFLWENYFYHKVMNCCVRTNISA